MKIALVRKTYTPYGGAEKYLSQVIERLGEEGHEVHIFAHHWELGGNGRKGAGTIAALHRVPMIGAPSFIEALSFAFFSRHLLREEQFDIIHSFERTLYQDIYRAGDGCHREWLAQRQKIDPWYKKATQPLNPLHRTLLFLERSLFHSPRLKRIVANSQRGKAEIMRHYGVKGEKITVIYNGVDLNAFQPRNRDLFGPTQRQELGIPPGAWVILFLGSGFRRKGLDGLIDGFGRVSREIPEAFLLVAGKDRWEPYRSAVIRKGLEKRVLFLGPTRKAKELYAASDLFALPTLYDPFSNACLEAMAAGVPVLTSRQNGASEVITDGRNGLLLPEAADSLAIAEKIRRIYHAPDRSVWGGEARRAAEKFSIAGAVEALLRIYADIRSPGNA